VLSSPVIWKRLPKGSRMRATLITSSMRLRTLTGLPSTMRVSTLFSMKTTAISRPTFSLVKRCMILPPLLSSVMETMGLPSRWSMPEAALMM